MMQLNKRFAILFFILTAFAATSFCQTDSTFAPPYLRFPTVPPFKLLKADSTTFYTKDDLPKHKAVVIVVFNPDCEHCQHETEELIANIDKFKNVQIVMSTNMLFDKMKEFYIKYNLEKYPKIWMGRDYQWVLPSFFKFSSIPFHAIYDKKHDLVTTFEGSMTTEKLLKAIK